MFLKIQFIESAAKILFWEIAKRDLSYALYYTELDFCIVFICNSLCFSLPNTYQNQYYESKLLAKSLHWSFESFCNKFLNIDKLFN